MLQGAGGLPGALLHTVHSTGLITCCIISAMSTVYIQQRVWHVLPTQRGLLPSLHYMWLKILHTCVHSVDILRWVHMWLQHFCSVDVAHELYIFWLGMGSLITIASEDLFYVLHFNWDAYTAKLDEGAETTDEGVEEASGVIAEISDTWVCAHLHVGWLMLVDSVKTAKWVGDCFIYTPSNQNNYFVRNELYTISLSDTYVSHLWFIPFSISSSTGQCTSLAMHPHIIVSTYLTKPCLSMPTHFCWASLNIRQWFYAVTWMLLGKSSQVYHASS